MIPSFSFTGLLLLAVYGLLAFLGSIALYPLLQTRLQVHYQKNAKNIRRIDRCPHIKKGRFIPTPYLANGKLQAVFGKFSKQHDPNIQFTPEIVSLSCGGKVALHWATQVTETEKAKANAKKALMVMLPGLTASSQDPYIRNISSEALENGYKVVVYHTRGNQLEMILPTTGYIDPLMDFKHAMDRIKSKYPDHKLLAVGHSYGANTIVNYLVKLNNEHGFIAAASVSNPWDFIKASFGVANTQFDLFLAQVMQGWARKNEKAFLDAPKHLNIDYANSMKATTLPGFDEHLIRRMFGYSELKEYYDDVSSAARLKSINIPLFCLNSRDDPILHYGSIPIDQSLQNENVIHVITYTGGHVGWFEGLFAPKRWYPKPTVEFLNCCYEEVMEGSH